MSRDAFSLIEIMMALTIAVAVTLATLACFCYPRDRIVAQACSLRQAEVQLRADEYFRSRGQWPSHSLQELNTGSWTLPVCPVDGRTYRLDSNSGHVLPHAH